MEKRNKVDSSDHFDENDFIEVGRDFVKAINHAATNSVLKKVFFPILLISPMTQEDDKKFSIRHKFKKSKHNKVSREKSMPAPSLSKNGKQIFLRL